MVRKTAVPLLIAASLLAPAALTAKHPGHDVRKEQKQDDKEYRKWLHAEGKEDKEWAKANSKERKEYLKAQRKAAKHQ